MENTLERVVERACRRMEVHELLDGKSSDYIKGFFAGVSFQTDYIVNSLSAKITEIEDILARKHGSNFYSTANQ